MPQAIRPLLLNAHDIQRLAPPLRDIVDIVESTYLMGAHGQVEVPTKVAVHPHGPQSFLHAMPAWVSGANALGMKWVSFFPKNAEKGLPVSSGLVVLNDPVNGLPVAIMEGMWMTYARTAACAAFAAKCAVNPMPRRLGLVGCGGLGEWSLRCISEVFPSIDRVFVASERAETRQAFCRSMSKFGAWELQPVEHVRLAVEHMDIVVSSVPKLEQHPVRGEWLSPGTVMIPLDVTGSWDDGLYNTVDTIICDHRDNLHAALTRYRPNLAIDESRFVSVDAIVTKEKKARASNEDRILAFMTGIGSIDMTLAWEIYRRAIQDGSGTHFAMT